MMQWQTLHDKLTAQLPDELIQRIQHQCIDTCRPILHVSSEQQKLLLVYPDDQTEQYKISTSRYGIGQQQGSYQTPAGLHEISDRIGEGEPAGRVFKARVATDEVCLADQNNNDDDVITSRILRLRGLQPGINQGGEVDSYERYIYLHGTADEAHIGQPASIGCVRLSNLDIMQLFQQVEVGDLVYID